jgi:hypothetical protein
LASLDFTGIGYCYMKKNADGEIKKRPAPGAAMKEEEAQLL